MGEPKPIGQIKEGQNVNGREVALRDRDDVVNFGIGDEVMLSPYDLAESLDPKVRTGTAVVTKIDRMAGTLGFEANLSALICAAATGDRIYHADAIEAWKRGRLAAERARDEARTAVGAILGPVGYAKLAQAQADIARVEAECKAQLAGLWAGPADPEPKVCAHEMTALDTVEGGTFCLDCGGKPKAAPVDPCPGCGVVGKLRLRDVGSARCAGCGVEVSANWFARFGREAAPGPSLFVPEPGTKPVWVDVPGGGAIIADPEAWSAVASDAPKAEAKVDPYEAHSIRMLDEASEAAGAPGGPCRTIEDATRRAMLTLGSAQAALEIARDNVARLEAAIAEHGRKAGG